MLRKFALILLLSGCAYHSGPVEATVKILDGSGTTGMQAAAKITEKYIAESRYLRVVIPDVTTPTEAQRLKALETAVVQPVFLESAPTGTIYVRCTIHEPTISVARQMASRCIGEIRDIALSLNIRLSH